MSKDKFTITVETEGDMTRLYKVLTEDMKSMHGGNATWTLGEWMPTVEKIRPCVFGYHLVTAEQLIEWLGPCVCEAEGAGEHIEQSDKSVWQRARVTKRLNMDEKRLRLFAADCAERVLPIFEKQYPDDKRPRQAIQSARDFANGKIDAAAGDAARDAARDAVRDAAGDAAGAAARDAAWAAADAARAAERAWQVKRLVAYLYSV